MESKKKVDVDVDDYLATIFVAVYHCDCLFAIITAYVRMSVHVLGRYFVAPLKG
jgi:hypothetical protein